MVVSCMVMVWVQVMDTLSQASYALYVLVMTISAGQAPVLESTYVTLSKAQLSEAIPPMAAKSATSVSVSVYGKSEPPISAVLHPS